VPQESLQSSTQAGPEQRAAAPDWRAIREHLESVKSAVAKQIEHYPPPIPACDAQFNYLLEQRDGISAELRLLDELRANAATPEDCVRAAVRFVHSSRFIDADAAARFCALAPGNPPR